MHTEFKVGVPKSVAQEEIGQLLKSCVHCGFCLATCPTYQVLGDELDSPRGRLYLIKDLVEGREVSRSSLTHLDRCLTCRSCETTCPSGVQYGQVIDLGRIEAEKIIGRPWLEQLGRRTLVRLLLNHSLLKGALYFGRILGPVLPAKLKDKIPTADYFRRPLKHLANPAKKVILARGCVQRSLAPSINESARHVLAQLNVAAVELSPEQCCGALPHHLSWVERSEALMKNNIDIWWPELINGAEAILSTASGCGAQIKEYAHHLRHDPKYAEKAKFISDKTWDISQYVAKQINELDDASRSQLKLRDQHLPIAVHTPCTLQHGQKVRDVPEKIMTLLGGTVVKSPESHLCCGSAGTYSLFQPSLSKTFRDNKINALSSVEPAIILTANMACQLHLQSGTSIPVRHWIVWLAEQWGN